MTIASIHLHALPFAWPLLWPLLEKAASRSDMSEMDVRRVIERGDAQLWAIVENKAPVAAVTTQITLQPERRCRVWLVGGTRMTEWADTFLENIAAWARTMGCVALWGSSASRPGWQRMTRLLGFEPIEPVEGNPSWARRI